MIISTCLHVTVSLALAAEPNPPKWPSNVYVFEPTSSNIEAVVQAAYAKNGGHEPANHGQFSDERYAFLFKPGEYNVDVPIGYYTQALGLGATPQEVVFTSAKGVFSQEQDYSIGGALSTFWRSAENFRTEADYKWYVGTGMMWAVSQAAPLRRVEVVNDLLLFEYEPPISPAGESSGGFFANLKVGTNASSPGHVKCGSQQQWFSRDSTVAGWEGGVWNMVFTGVDGAPQTHCGNTPPGPFTTVDRSPVIAEKPFIVFENNKYSLKVPHPKTQSHGADHSTSAMTSVPFEQVYVASPADSAAQINAKLGSGLHVVLAPGIYHLDAPLTLSHSGQVLLGLGLATLVPTRQNAVISVGDVDGVRVAGLLLQAGPHAGGTMSPALLEWGTGAHVADSSNPGVISDVFARVGGPDGTPSNPVATDAIFVLRTGHVIIDNAWLWRADHATGAVTYTSNRCNHGLVVESTATDVTTYGLAVEHTEQDLTLWAGDRGKVFFYQSELPYIVNQQQFGDPGYAGFRVTGNVTDFDAWGIGVYCFFNQYDVDVKSAIVAPPALEPRFHNSLTVFLNGHGRIEHILNDHGDPATKAGTAQYLC